jgi:hypothetical protein
VLGPLRGPENRGRTTIGMYDSRDSMMATSRRVGAEIERVQSKYINISNYDVPDGRRNMRAV